MSVYQNELRTFAVELHGRPGVAEACLALQERVGLDVNVLLAAAWLGICRRTALAEPDVARLNEQVHGWHRDVVAPLRVVRRRLKAGPPPAPSEATARFRADLQAVEIGAELLELDELQVAACRLPLHATSASAAEAAIVGMRAVVDYFAGRSTDGDEMSAMITIVSAAEVLACGD